MKVTGRSMQGRKRRLAKLLWGLFLLGIAWWLTRSTVIFVGDMMVKTCAAYSGVLEEKKPVTALVVPGEYTYPLPPGEAEFLVTEGERVARGTLLARVRQANGKVAEVRAPQAGLFTSRVDGYEGLLSGDTLQYIRLKDVANLLPATDKGPAFKIIDNTRPLYLVVEVPGAGVGVGVGEIKSFCFFLPGGPVSLKGSVLRVENGEEKTWLVVSCYEPFPGMSLYRQLNGEMIVSRHQGIIVPVSSWVRSGDQEGIFIRDGKRLLFQAATPVGQAGGSLAIRGINEGMLVVSNPRVAKIVLFFSALGRDKS